MAARKLDSWQKGEEALYNENDGIMRCRVVEAGRRTGNFINIELEILEVIQEPRFTMDPETLAIGRQFTATAHIDEPLPHASGGWDLVELADIGTLWLRDITKATKK